MFNFTKVSIGDGLRSLSEVFEFERKKSVDLWINEIKTSLVKTLKFHASQTGEQSFYISSEDLVEFADYPRISDKNYAKKINDIEYLLEQLKIYFESEDTQFTITGNGVNISWSKILNISPNVETQQKEQTQQSDVEDNQENYETQ